MSKAENEAEEVVEVPDLEEQEQEEAEAEGPPEAGAESGEVVVSIGEESPASEEEQAPGWVKELRKENREKAKRIRELEAEREQSRQVQPIVLGAEPTLEGCDFDTEKFKRDWLAWNVRKGEVEAETRKKEDAKKAEQEAWQSLLDNYGKLKGDLKVSDYDEAEAVVLERFNVTQQGVVLTGAENPALVVYALGKNPQRAQELAAIKDPTKFAFAVAKLETQLKVTPRKNVPAPEKRVVGSTSISGADVTLQKLEAEAQRTGDRSKVIAHKRSLRQAA